MRLITHYTDRQIRNSLRAWYSSATEEQQMRGCVWYDEAEEIAHNIAACTGVDIHTAGAVIAALSPRNKWERNVDDARALCKAWARGEDPESVRVCTFNANKNKAWRILEGDDDVLATSPKVAAFANTILNGAIANCIVVDVWHTRACITKPKEGRIDCQSAPTYRQYKRLEGITLEEAKFVEQAPCYYQATIWCVIRDTWGGLRDNQQLDY